jgi:hypothetical protein
MEVWIGTQMIKPERLAETTIVVLDVALAHLENANLQTSLEEARKHMGKAVIELTQLIELAQAALIDGSLH